MSTRNTLAQLGDLATSRVRISRRDITLLGTSGGVQSRRALLRLPSGQTVTVRTGDQVGAARVVAIEEGRVLLGGSGEAIALTVPAP